MNRNAGLILAGATLIGGFAVGKAAVDHVMDTRAGKVRPLEQAEEEDSVKDVVSFLIAMFNIGYLVHEGPKMYESWQEFDAGDLLQ